MELLGKNILFEDFFKKDFFFFNLVLKMFIIFFWFYEVGIKLFYIKMIKKRFIKLFIMIIFEGRECDLGEYYFLYICMVWIFMNINFII